MHGSLISRTSIIIVIYGCTLQPDLETGCMRTAERIAERTAERTAEQFCLNSVQPNTDRDPRPPIPNPDPGPRPPTPDPRPPTPEPRPPTQVLISQPSTGPVLVVVPAFVPVRSYVEQLFDLRTSRSLFNRVCSDGVARIRYQTAV